jgi:hypothetical protein
LGQWLWTDYGWYWLSDEPFGWITFHSGRWYCDDYYGWIWIPDDVWGPAWVEWCHDDDYIGWVPLPTYATFHMNVGIRFTTHWIAPVHYWNFVRYHRFGSVIRYRDNAPLEYAMHLIHTSRHGVDYGIDHERIINRGVNKTIIERLGNVRFKSTAVREIRESTGERLSRSTDNPQTKRIEVYRPSREEMQNSSDRIEARCGERNLSMVVTKFEQPRIESAIHSEMRPSMNEKKTMDRRVRTVYREEDSKRDNYTSVYCTCSSVHHSSIDRRCAAS